MRPAREGDIPVRVKNSYNPKAPGTLITKTRDMSKVCRSVDRHIDMIF
jgi:aspartate kinase